MRDYLKRVLELAKPYRNRLALGLACGFISGMLTPTLGLSLKLAVDAVFPRAEEPEISGAAATGTNATPNQSFSTIAPAGTNTAVAANSNPAGPETKQVSGKKKLPSWVPSRLKGKLDKLQLWFRPPGTPSPLRMALVIAFIPASMFIRSFLGYLNSYLLSWVGIRAASDLRLRLFAHLLQMPLGFFNKTNTGDLMSRVEGAMAVNSTIKDSFGVIIREPISVIVLVGFLISLDWRLSLSTLLVFPLCLVPLTIFGRKWRKSHHGAQSKFANVQKVLVESFTGIRVIKGYNLENAVLEEFRGAIRAVTSYFMRSVRAGELPGPLIEFIGSIGVALVFVYYAFAPTTHRAPAGDMFAFFFAVFSMYAPLKNLSRLQHQLLMAKAGVDPVYQLLAIKTSLPEPANPKPLKAQGAPIRFENVDFSYDKRRVLHKVNLTIQPGQLVALVGRTGSGKTSLVNLLLRFYDPQSGAVLIGDTDIRAVSSRDLRANMAVVTQETILFNDTIRHNISLGRAGATNAEIEEAARLAYAHEFIVQQPAKYETAVGEKGVNVSGGQRQRIAIARAILRNAPILILDEATNQLDAEAEQIVQTALEDLMRGRTTICIAHRLSTIRKADVIVVLDGGRIVETGTHGELIRARGLYSKLYEMSFDEPGGPAAN